MQFFISGILFLSAFSLFVSTLDAVSITTIVNGNAALTQLALNMDEPLLTLTSQSGIAAAKDEIDIKNQTVPRNFHDLTACMGYTLSGYMKNATNTTYDPVIENTVTESYGLLANTIEELMIDLSYQEPILTSYSLKRIIYKNLLQFNTTFAAYATFMHGVVGDIYHQNITRNETSNAVFGITNATEKYAPIPTPIFMES